MSDPNDTLPPRQPNTPRVLLRKLWAWFLAHPEYSVPLLAFIIGVGLGKWAF